MKVIKNVTIGAMLSLVYVMTGCNGESNKVIAQSATQVETPVLDAQIWNPDEATYTLSQMAIDKNVKESPELPDVKEEFSEDGYWVTYTLMNRPKNGKVYFRVTNNDNTSASFNASYAELKGDKFTFPYEPKDSKIVSIAYPGQNLTDGKIWQEKFTVSGLQQPEIDVEFGEMKTEKTLIGNSIRFSDIIIIDSMNEGAEEKENKMFLSLNFSATKEEALETVVAGGYGKDVNMRQVEGNRYFTIYYENGNICYNSAVFVFELTEEGIKRLGQYDVIKTGNGKLEFTEWSQKAAERTEAWETR